MLIGSGTLTPRLDRLEAAGLLERRPDPRDRRGRVLRLASAGEQIVPVVVRELLAVENDLLDAVPRSERRRLSETLADLAATAEVNAGS